MDTYFNRYSCSWLKTIITVVILMVFITANAGGQADPYMVFEGYQVGEGAPPVGGTIGSQAAGTAVDPWFGTIAYKYMDGWNHNPRVSASEYGSWVPGGHAGTGTDMQGWNSLINGSPERYVVDFSGYEWESSFFHTNMLDPLFGHEDRLYQRIDEAGEGEWQILDTITSTTVASGTIGDIFTMDIFYDPLNYGLNAYVNGTGTITANNDGGAFYNELIARWGTSVLNFSGLTEDPPIQAENPGAQLIDQWALYGTRWTVSPVPEPTTICLLAIGSLVMLRKKK
jgi:hypothetical protein